MSISSTTCRNNYTGTSLLHAYSYSFYILDEDDLTVTVATAAGVETTLTKTTDYTVSGVGAANGGTVTLVNAAQAWLTSGELTTGYKLTIRRVMDLTQTADIRNQGEFFPETHEDVFDTLVMQVQQLQDQLNRAIKFRETSTTTGIDMPELVASKLLGINSAGTALDLYTQGAASLSVYAPPSGGMVTDTLVQDAMDMMNPRVTGSTASPTAIVAGTGITAIAAVCLQTQFIEGSGGAVDISVNPQISAGTRIGQRLVLIGCSDSNTVFLEDAAGLYLNGDYTLGNGSAIELFWDGTYWKEMHRNDL